MMRTRITKTEVMNHVSALVTHAKSLITEMQWLIDNRAWEVTGHSGPAEFFNHFIKDSGIDVTMLKKLVTYAELDNEVLTQREIAKLMGYRSHSSVAILNQQRIHGVPATEAVTGSGARSQYQQKIAEFDPTYRPPQVVIGTVNVQLGRKAEAKLKTLMNEEQLTRQQAARLALYRGLGFRIKNETAE